MIRHSIQLSSDTKWHGILWHNLVLMGTLHTVYVQTKEIVGIVVFDMIAIRYGDVLTLYNCISGRCNFTVICTFMYNWYSWQDGVCVDCFYVLCWCQKWALSVVDNRGIGSIFNSLHLLYISKGTGSMHLLSLSHNSWEVHIWSNAVIRSLWASLVRVMHV